MRRLIVLGAMAAVAVGAWNVGNRLSTDAISMAVGLVFGTLALVPATVMVLATSGRRRSDDDYNAAYQQGIRDVTALARGTLPPGHVHTAQWQDDGKTIDGTCTAYTAARPFAIVPAPPPEPIDPNACPDWCEPWIWDEVYDKGRTAPPRNPNERRYRVDWGV